MAEQKIKVFFGLYMMKMMRGIILLLLSVYLAYVNLCHLYIYVCVYFENDILTPTTSTGCLLRSAKIRIVTL